MTFRLNGLGFALGLALGLPAHAAPLHTTSPTALRLPAGEPAPEPFARPENTLAVEQASGFGPKIGD